MLRELAIRAGKRALYSVRPPRWPDHVDLTIGYVFHTERIYDARVFDQLMTFCRAYKQLTGKRATATLIPPTNLRLRYELSKAGFPEAAFIDRARALADVSTLGYHGHYWLDEDAYTRAAPKTNGRVQQLEMRRGQFLQAPFKRQFHRDLAWFEQNDLPHNNAYAAGWWTMNEWIVEALFEYGFRVDYSISKSPWFQSEFAAEQLARHGLRTGEVFAMHNAETPEDRGLVFVQNLIGCHTTPFPEDFVRVLNRFLPAGGTVTGVVNSHDYDLHPTFTLRCLERLSKKGVRFFEHHDVLTGHAPGTATPTRVSRPIPPPTAATQN